MFKIQLAKVNKNGELENKFWGIANIKLMKDMIKVFNATSEKGYLIVLWEDNEIVNTMSIEEFIEL